jgi:oligopeptide transport system permease protein
MIGLSILCLMICLPLLVSYLGLDPTFINPDLTTSLPSLKHPFGTDELGRDMLARLAMGAQMSLFIGLATALVSVVIGALYGTIAASFHGRVLDTTLMRLIDIVYSLPALMIVILFTLFLGRNTWSLVLALSLFSWPDTARVIRGQVIQLQKEEFIEAYHSLGGGQIRLAVTHYLPNLLALLILTTTITVPRAILTESTLSFVGLGVSPPQSSWGTMINDGWQMIRIAPHLVLLPSAFLFLTMMALNLLGESLKTLARVR